MTGFMYSWVEHHTALWWFFASKVRRMFVQEDVQGFALISHPYQCRNRVPTHFSYLYAWLKATHFFLPRFIRRIVALSHVGRLQLADGHAYAEPAPCPYLPPFLAASHPIQLALVHRPIESLPIKCVYRVLSSIGD